ncbi:VacJ family lipoprotein [Alteromonas sp. ASW11-19]|uniref:VacJ family lipoprotein n=1 Tax=Alteromonas salexigens TaxID=2982530 RepID=A0ABT2VS41_9ALTE|nr:VacJ family lipoprotein [Alteromonas salexigens]MCU7555864.1 VacJ family lipoprotein [Alteromonas salexigens]
MRVYKQFLLAVAAGFLSACASPPDKEVEPAKPVAANKTENAKVRDLSAGETVTVTTSQGTMEVEPAVVAITDAQTSPDVTQDVYYHDPWEGMNRAIFSFNHYLYSYVLLPAADGYRYVVPAVARDKIGNAFNNIREPLNLVNNTFAGEFDEAGTNLGRFIINTTVGLFGLFDPATDWFDLAPEKQTVADTLSQHDIRAGPYLVLPLLGPSDSRGAFSTVTESVLHPINFVAEPPESYQLRFFDGFDDFSSQADTYRSLYENAEDPYLYFRNQYIQGKRRDAVFSSDNQPQNP